ncbi:MAG: alpha/beta hydrolase [Chloroflexi bacterium]|nr:MAG: alpha/beta hydrolase [Chloroflexota bacterium]
MFNKTRARQSSALRRPRLAVERLDVKDLQFADELPEGRMVELPGRGTAFVRIAAGPAGAPTVLLLHGLMATADLNWSLAVPALAGRFNVVAPDLRGHGRGMATRRFTGEECAEDMAAIVRTLQLGRVIVVGYSLGGLVAQLEQAARRFPERIRRAAMLAMLAPKSADCPQGRWLMGEVRRHDTMALLDAIAEAAKFNSGSWLSDSTCPSAVIVTQDDMVLSVEAQRELARVLGRPTVYEIPGDHFVCIKRPREFNEALVAACAGVQG